MKRKWITTMVCTLLCLCAWTTAPVFAQGEAGILGEEELLTRAGETNLAIEYYKNQLDATEKIFYEALNTLYTTGNLKTGTGSVELTRLNQQQLQAYQNGDGSLAQAFLSARDAFMQDHSDIFYVDFTKLTFRMGQKNDQFLAYINNGTNTDYYAPGFTSAEQIDMALIAVDAKKAEILQIITNRINDFPENQRGTLSTEEKITIVHDELVNRMTYEYDSQENPRVTGIHEALVRGKANCQGYSKSMKWVLDALNIPCVLVTGSGVNSQNQKEEHMWNYVQVDDAWYGVDVTWDDPTLVESAALEKTAAPENRNHRYLLKGSGSLNMNHSPYGQFAPGSKIFIYPELSQVDYSVSKEAVSDYESDTLSVYAEKGVDEENDEYTLYRILYKVDGKALTIKEIEAKGLSLGFRATDEDRNGVFMPWGDLGATVIDKTVAPIKLYVYNKGSVQLAVTKEKVNIEKTVFDKDLSITGNHEAVSKPLKVSYYRDHVSPPQIRKIDPPTTQTTGIQKQHYTVEFKEELSKVDENLPIGMKVENTQPHLNYEVSNLMMRPSEYQYPFEDFKRKSTIVEFDFQPDTTYQGYANKYELNLTNLVGKESKLAPVVIRVSTTYPMLLDCPSKVYKGAIPEAFVVGFPTLVVNEGMDIFEGSTSPNALDIRLVASIMDATEEEKMLAALGAEVKSSASYDLSLSCKNIVAKLKPGLGYHLTIGLPYPDGFNYKDNTNVQFKAYHYTKQGDGSYEAKELICRITPQGLQVIAEEFSPFTVVAMEKTASSTRTEQIINIAQETQGGSIKTKNSKDEDIGAAGLYPLKVGESKSFVITPNEGYVIDKIVVNGEPISLTDSEKNYTHIVKYTENEQTLKASFIAETVKTTEATIGFTPITPEIIAGAPILDSIKIVNVPIKTIYTVGEKFDATGMAVKAVYKDGSEKTITGYTVDQEPLTKDKKAITVKYSENNGTEKTTTILITVNNADPVNPTIKDLLGATYRKGEAAKPLDGRASVSDGGSISYQWYKNKLNNTGGTAIDKATEANYTPVTTEGGTQYYYVIATNKKDGKEVRSTSNIAKITIIESSVGPGQPEPTPPVDPDQPEPSPDINEDKAIVDIGKAREGDTVLIPVKNNGSLPKKLLEAAKGKDLTLNFDYGEYQWSINGKTIGPMTNDTFDLTVSDINDSKITEELKPNEKAKQFEIKNNGVLPFEGRLTYQLEAKNFSEESEVHLYYYNEKTKTLEFMETVIVKEGKVQLTFKHTSKYVLRTVLEKPTETFAQYKTHVEGDGWQEFVEKGAMSGTERQAKRLEGIQIKMNRLGIGIDYQTHSQDIGWQDWKKDGETSGTEGENKRLEAIRIKLTGTDKDKYDVYYQVHAENEGWLGWAKNGEYAGTEGLSYRLEAIKVVLVSKGSAAPGSTDRPFLTKETLVKNIYANYTTHVEMDGWKQLSEKGAISGTEGKALRLEGIKINLINQGLDIGIDYKTHIEDIGWEKEYQQNGAMSGTEGQAKRLEAIQIKLTGGDAGRYDVYYQVHAENYGWLDWAKNGESAGTEGQSLRLEAIKIMVLPKGTSVLGEVTNTVIN